MHEFPAQPVRALALAAIATLALTVAHEPARAEVPARAALHIVLVLDGLRPDSINERDTPNLQRLKTEGVSFANSHAVFPTVTRVNAAALGTGSYPARNGIVGNSVFIPEVDPKAPFSTDDAKKLLLLGDHVVTAPGLGEALKAMGERFVVVSSGSSGGALLVAPNAPRGVGVTVNGGFDGAALPKEAGVEVLKRFGAAPKKGGAHESHGASVDWAAAVLRDYVLPEMKPRVVVHWMTEPDHIQHGFGLGSPEALAAIRHDDEEVGKLLAKLGDLGLRERTNIVVVSDHGFTQTMQLVNVKQELSGAGLLPPGETGEVVVASSGQAIAVHVKGHDRARILAIVEFLQKQPWCGVIFTARGSGAPHEGSVPGTFALEYAHLGGHERSADIVFTFPWSSERNRLGVPGLDYGYTASAKTGPADSDSANHGGIGPWTVTNTMLAWGPDFKRGVVVRSPASNVDVAPTLLHLLGQDAAAAAMDGRPLLEALAGGPDAEQVAVEVRTVRVSRGSYAAAIQASEVGGKRYVDKGWRLPQAETAGLPLVRQGFQDVTPDLP